MHFTAVLRYVITLIEAYGPGMWRCLSFTSGILLLGLPECTCSGDQTPLKVLFRAAVGQELSSYYPYDLSKGDRLWATGFGESWTVEKDFKDAFYFGRAIEQIHFNATAGGATLYCRLNGSLTGSAAKDQYVSIIDTASLFVTIYVNYPPGSHFQAVMKSSSQASLVVPYSGLRAETKCRNSLVYPPFLDSYATEVNPNVFNQYGPSVRSISATILADHSVEYEGVRFYVLWIPGLSLVGESDSAAQLHFFINDQFKSPGTAISAAAVDYAITIDQCKAEVSFENSLILDNDDRTVSWDMATSSLPGTPAYTGVWDEIEWSVAVNRPKGPHEILSWSWQAIGPNKTINGPKGSHGEPNTKWRQSLIDWEPGDYKIVFTIETDCGEVVTATLNQPIGVRTWEVFGIGALYGQVSPMRPSFDTLTRFASDCIVTKNLFDTDKFNDPTSILYVPEILADRIWVNYDLVRATVNQYYLPHLDVDQPAEEFFGLSPHRDFRAFARCQFKYLVDNSGKVKGSPVPVELLVAKAGHTPAPCVPYWVPFVDPSGEEHPANGRYLVSSDRTSISFLLEVRAGKLGQRGFERLNRRQLPWVYYKFKFDAKSGALIKGNGPSLNPDGPDESGDFSTLPSISIYRRVYNSGTRKFDAWLLQKRDEDLWQFLGIGKIIGSPHYR